jgi:hypothetical protein
MKVQDNLDLGLSQLLSALVENLTADPATPTAGRVIYRTDISTFKVGTGSVWQSFYLSTTRLDQITAPTAAVGMNSQKLTSLADGTAATDAVTKQQLDAASAGLDPKASVRLATTAALPAYTGTGTLTASANGALTVDGVAVAVNDRILVKNEATGARNGPYTVSATGSAGAPWVLVRSSDADTSAEVNAGMFLFVEEGTQQDTGWVLTTNNPITLDTTTLAFSKFTAAASGVVKYAADITGDGSTTAFAVTHSLGTTDIQAQVFEATTNALVIVDTVRTSTTVVTITFATAPANLKVYRVVVMG